jgi:uncharacterized protein (TIGR02246 family)
VDSARNDPQTDARDSDQPLPNPEVDEFFLKMKNDLRRPKPSEEAVATALRAIQKFTGEVAQQEQEEIGDASTVAPADAPFTGEPGAQCPRCRGVNSASNRFCGFCGETLQRTAERSDRTTNSAPSVNVSASTGQEQHVHHHYYHHHYFPGNAPLEREVVEAAAEATAGSPPAEPVKAGEAETALRTLVQSWIMACNSKRLDELAALYVSDAVLLRPNLANMRGRAAIGQYFERAVAHGLGDVELDCVDIGVLGEIACLTGNSRMLVPIGTGMRQDRTGKFLLLVRRDSGAWKILADIWCMDAPPATLARKA